MTDAAHSAPRNRKWAALILVVALALGAWVWMRRAGAESAELASPKLALAAISAKSLFFNGPALPWLVAQRSDLLAAADRDAGSERVRAMSQAVLEPKLFRQLDRRERFDVVLLVGDPSQYRPLLEHLLETPDWKLTYLDHSSLVFRRDAAAPWEPARLETMAAQFRSNRERSLFLSRAAVKLVAVRQPAEARKCIDAAQALDAGVPDLWNALAVYRLLRGELTPALADVNRALAINPDFLPAVATKTQILYASKQFSAAYDLSERLIAAFPDDPALLFYHAKICHESHAYTAEIRALTRLIERAKADGRTVSGYQVYLAQAYAGAGLAQPAVEQFELALTDPDLPAEQRKFARETLEQIKSRAGLN